MFDKLLQGLGGKKQSNVTNIPYDGPFGKLLSLIGINKEGVYTSQKPTASPVSSPISSPVPEAPLKSGIEGSPENLASFDSLRKQIGSPVPSPRPQVRPSTGGARNPSFPKFNVPDVVRSSIDSASNEFGLPSSLLYDIALQESSFDPTLKNSLPGSTAGGLFQFTDGTWDTVKNYANRPGSSLKNWNNPDKFDPAANARAAAYLIKNGQLGRWTASSDVWGPHYTKDELLDFFSQTRPEDIPELFR